MNPAVTNHARAALLAALLFGASALTACSGQTGTGATDKTLNVYNWAGYIAPDTVAKFERETGIQVHYSTYESNEISETKLLTGHSNYDVVTSADAFFERELHAGAFRKLDKTALPNSVNLDPEILQKLAVHDPGNLYAVPYLWTQAGLGYNVDKVRERLGSAEPDSWSLLFDPKNAAKLKDCGIMIVDSPEDVLPSVLIYLGKDPNSHDPADWTAAADVLMQIRPFVRSIEAEGIIGDLANGSLCLGLTWGGEVTQARYRALETHDGVKIRYFVPREGAVAGLDMLAIPADAPHPANAHIWLNYLMRPEVMAEISNALKYPNGNKASLPLVQEAIKDDPAIYPDARTRNKLFIEKMQSPEVKRLMTRLWTRFRTGQ
ncbi:MAG: polyamine ABC transporter substrate-binding protein [Steroidobacteraceae bacterium]|jgi:putrescine transport system substrate-binding protein